MPVRTTLEIECEKECGCEMRLRPMRFLTPVYREWLKDPHIRALSTMRLKWWIQQQIVERRDLPFDRERDGFYTPMDYHLLLQLAYDLDLSDEMEMILWHARWVARMCNWSWRAEALWKQLF